jgi:hypothetical protein
MLEHIFSDVSGASWDLALRSRNEEVDDHFDLLYVGRVVVLDLHELSDELDHTWKIVLTEENLVNVQLFIALLELFLLFA